MGIRKIRNRVAKNKKRRNTKEEKYCNVLVCTVYYNL